MQKIQLLAKMIGPGGLRVISLCLLRPYAPGTLPTPSSFARGPSATPSSKGRYHLRLVRLYRLAWLFLDITPQRIVHGLVEVRQPAVKVVDRQHPGVPGCLQGFQTDRKLRDSDV